MENRSAHTDLPCELVTSVLKGGMQMAEMSKLSWLSRLVNIGQFLAFSNLIHTR